MQQKSDVEDDGSECGTVVSDDMASDKRHMFRDVILVFVHPTAASIAVCNGGFVSRFVFHYAIDELAHRRCRINFDDCLFCGRILCVHSPHDTPLFACRPRTWSVEVVRDHTTHRTILTLSRHAFCDSPISVVALDLVRPAQDLWFAYRDGRVICTKYVCSICLDCCGS